MIEILPPLGKYEYDTCRILLVKCYINNSVRLWSCIRNINKYWTIDFDGSLQLQGARAGILVMSPKGESFKYVLKIHFVASNNATENEALHHGIRIAVTFGIYRVNVLGDLMLVVN
jgi:hypothetical protein